MSHEKGTVEYAQGWTDGRLVRACLDGDEQAWSALIDRYKRLIYSIPVRYGMTSDEAGDIFQQVCLDLLSELAKVKDPKSLGAWLIKVASHKCLQWMRRERRVTALTSEGADLAATERADALLIELEREQILHQAVAELAPRCRELVRMLFFETPAVPYEQVASNLRLARGSIGFIRMRCLKKLRVLLLEKGFR